MRAAFCFVSCDCEEGEDGGRVVEFVDFFVDSFADLGIDGNMGESGFLEKECVPVGAGLLGGAEDVFHFFVFLHQGGVYVLVRVPGKAVVDGGFSAVIGIKIEQDAAGFQ